MANPVADAALAARDLKHAVEQGNVPLGVLAMAGLIIPGYGGAKAVGKASLKKLAKEGTEAGAARVAKEGAEEAATSGYPSPTAIRRQPQLVARYKQYMKDLTYGFGPAIRTDRAGNLLSSTGHELGTKKMRKLYFNHLKARHGIDDLDAASPEQIRYLFSDWNNARRVHTQAGQDFADFARKASKPPPIPKAEAPSTPRTGLTPEKQQEGFLEMLERRHREKPFPEISQGGPPLEGEALRKALEREAREGPRPSRPLVFPRKSLEEETMDAVKKALE
jgi:hypothetical protein